MNDTQYFGTAALPWPAGGAPTNFDIGFATAAPEGAAPRTTEFAGEVFEQDGRQLPDGTRVEARIGNALCGVASVRTNGDFTGFSLSVVGPESIAGCDAGDGDLPRRWTSRDHNGGQRLSAVPSLDLVLPGPASSAVQQKSFSQFGLGISGTGRLRPRSSRESWSPEPEPTYACVVPMYLDRHDAPGISAEEVAAHELDVALQEQPACGITPTGSIPRMARCSAWPKARVRRPWRRCTKRRMA
jgi:hypothetical protein